MTMILIEIIILLLQNKLLIYLIYIGYLVGVEKDFPR